MEEENFDRKKFIRTETILFSILSLFLFAGMMFYASTKVVMVSAEEAETDAVEAVKEEETEANREYLLDFKSSSADGSFVVPFPEELTEENLCVSERFDQKTLTLTLKTENSSFFKNNAPSGDFTGITSIREKIGDDSVTLVFTTEDYVTVKTEREGKKLTVSLSPIRKDETVIAVDPLYGGASTGAIVGSLQEKEINLRLAKKIEKLAEGKNYRLVLVRGADETMLTEERMETLEILGADYYLGIGLSSNVDDLSEYGMSAVYNKEYFRNGLENVDFADALLRTAAEDCKDRAKSLTPADDRYVILKTFEGPAMIFYAGTITNTEEAQLLSQDEYLERIAESVIGTLDRMVEE